MKNVEIIAVNNGKTTVINAHSAKALVDGLNELFIGASFNDLIFFQRFKIESYTVHGLHGVHLSIRELSALKNSFDPTEDESILRVLSAIHCSDEIESADLDEIIRSEVPKVKGLYIMGSDLKAKDLHFEAYKAEIIRNMEDNPVIAPFTDKIDWDMARKHYFSKVQMNYFGDAIVFIKKIA